MKILKVSDIEFRYVINALSDSHSYAMMRKWEEDDNESKRIYWMKKEKIYWETLKKIEAQANDELFN